MIRVGIAGESGDITSHLIQILVNHPDVELAWVADPELEGEEVSDYYKELYGDTYLRFTKEPDFDVVDVVFLTPLSWTNSRNLLNKYKVPETVRLIDFSADHAAEALKNHAGPDDQPDPMAWVYGLPELMRKPLVRGARRAIVPSLIGGALSLALLPFAKNGLLGPDVHVAAITPLAEPGTAGETISMVDHEAADEVLGAVRTLQPGVDFSTMIVESCGGWVDGLSLTAYFKLDVSIERIQEMFEEFYDDHNFVFITPFLPNLNQVLGTNKCLIYLDRVGEYAAVSLVMDDAIKGAAGTAVHLMNLLFGLQERVGLTLKPHSIH